MICLDRSIAKPGETPEIAEAANLLREFQNSGAAHLIEQSRQEQSTIRQAMESMRAPRLDMKNRIASITGFVELQSIGHAVRTLPSFDTKLADRPRIDLGDWRGKITCRRPFSRPRWPARSFTGPAASIRA